MITSKTSVKVENGDKEQQTTRHWKDSDKLLNRAEDTEETLEEELSINVLLNMLLNS